MIQRLTEEEINIFPHYIELFCHRLAKDMLVNFLLFISTPMLTKLCLRWILLNLISMMDCESFKKDWLMSFLCVFVVAIQLMSDFMQCPQQLEGQKHVGNYFNGKNMGCWVYTLLGLRVWAYSFTFSNSVSLFSI